MLGEGDDVHGECCSVPIEPLLVTNGPTSFSKRKLFAFSFLKLQNYSSLISVCSVLLKRALKVIVANMKGLFAESLNGTSRNS